MACLKTSEGLSGGQSCGSQEVARRPKRLDDYLTKWVPKLVADVLEGARLEFYKAVAKITQGYVRMDRQ